MKVQIRGGVFETNSSSVHSLVVCTKAEFEAFKKGELFYDSWSGELVSLEEKMMTPLIMMNSKIVDMNMEKRILTSL